MDTYRIQAFLVIAFPVLLSIGIILIPVVPDYADHHTAAQAVKSAGRWFAGHLIAAVAFVMSVVSVSAISGHLRQRAYRVPRYISPLMAVGAGLYAAGLGADGIGPIAVQASGSTPALFFDGSGWYVSGTFMAATVFFGVGLISTVYHANKSHLVTGILSYVTLFSALVFIIIPAVPSGWGLYGEAAAAYGVFLPIGAAIWQTADLQPTGEEDP